MSGTAAPLALIRAPSAAAVAHAGSLDGVDVTTQFNGSAQRV